MYTVRLQDLHSRVLNRSTVGLVPETAVGLSDQAAMQVMAMRVAAEMQAVAMQAAVAAGMAANP